MQDIYIYMWLLTCCAAELETSHGHGLSKSLAITNQSINHKFGIAYLVQKATVQCTAVKSAEDEKKSGKVEYMGRVRLPPGRIWGVSDLERYHLVRPLCLAAAQTSIPLPPCPHLLSI